jgi:rhodanese-related sulfurtransferase
MFSFFKNREKKYQDLSPSEFEAGMKAPDAVLIDVRTAGEFSGKKIKGARNLDITSKSFENQIKNLPKDKSYYLYCRSGNRSGQACDLMASMGFEKVYNLGGGIISWPYN